MSHPKRRRAGYEEVLKAPEHMVAEVVEGDLHLTPRPAGPHTRAASVLCDELLGPFDRGRGGPGGWIILVEPELHLGAEPAIVVPDLAGWRRERMPMVLNEAFFTVVPDWVCEIVSPSSGRFDRVKKLPLYAREGVRFAWLVDPLQRTLEVYRSQEGRWMLLSSHAEEERVRAEPFDALEMELGALWADVQVAP